MNVYAFDRKEKPGDLLPKHDYGSMLNIFPFAGNNENPDFSSLNIAFFKHLDNIIELLNEEGIIAHLMIYVWNKKVNWPKPGSKEDNMYFDYIVKRYQAYPNIFWDISKEALSYGRDDMAYISDRIDRLRKLDVYDRLLTVHDHKYCVNYPDKIDVFSTQDWGTDLYNRMLTIGNDFNTKPIFNIEHGGYEQCQYDVFIGNYVDPEVCLRRNYECLFAGVYSTYYWQCTSWNVIIHDPLVSAEPKPKFHYYLHMRNFMDTHHFELLNPVSHVSASGFALHNPGTGEYFYYVPVENTAIDVKNLPVAKDVEIRWFNTISGEYSTPFHQEWSDYFRLVKHFQEASILIVKLIDKYAIIR